MTEHSCLRCRDYLEQERAWQQVLREKQDAWFKVRQDLELRLTLTEWAVGQKQESMMTAIVALRAHRAKKGGA